MSTGHNGQWAIEHILTSKKDIDVTVVVSTSLTMNMRIGARMKACIRISTLQVVGLSGIVLKYSFIKPHH